MAMTDDATTVLLYMATHHPDERATTAGSWQFDGQELAEGTGIEPSRINDAVAWLERNGYTTASRYLGTAPFTFGRVELTSLGRHEVQRLTAEEEAPAAARTRRSLQGLPVPVGSPFRFTEQDWEFVQRERAKSRVVRVVLGYQFRSDAYDSNRLVSHVRDHFNQAVAIYNRLKGHENITLEFVPLRAGYGEHLFNQIARDIIAADIAVFETSDLNPNVMIELGVALTWGIRVLPVREAGRQVPPSDISGQTWASYQDSGLKFLDGDFRESLVTMIERVMRRKAAGSADLPS
jgi:hypothetical protein